MSVYVDNYFYQYGRMKMSHMIADTLEELHAMAESLGIRHWFQDSASFPHYDLCKSKRQCTIGAGAVPLERRDFVHTMRRIREARVLALMTNEPEKI